MRLVQLHYSANSDLPPEFYDVELARYLGVSLSHLYNMTCEDRDVSESVWRGRRAGMFNKYQNEISRLKKDDNTADVHTSIAMRYLLRWHLGL